MKTKQGSDIDLIADFNGPVGQFNWAEAGMIAENIIGREYKVDLCTYQLLKTRSDPIRKNRRN